MQHYELLLLLNAQVADATLEGVVANVRTLLGKHGAIITKDDPLGKRRLAHAIKKQSQGAYHVLEFDAPAQTIQELDRILRLTPEVLRHLVVTARLRTAEDIEREEALRARIEARRRAAQAAQQSSDGTAPTTAGATPAAEPQKVSLEQLDQKLEHILEDTPKV